MNKKILFSLAAIVGIGTTIGLSCSKSSSYNSTPPAPVATGNNITISNMKFSPSSKTVAKGTIVKWTNNDGYPHTVTSNDAVSFDSGYIDGGGSYSYTASTPGTFDYHCTIHGLAMSGTLIVSP
jgi:plastocyanin